MENKDQNLAAMFADEAKARAWLESKLWPNGPVCPHCACLDVYDLAKTRAGLYKCKACKKQFTVRIGTIMEESKIPISKWLMAVHLMTSSKKGVSSRQIARECGITQKSAWFVNHRIGEAMKQEPMASMLEGTVEVDETYVGGKPRKGTDPHKRGRGATYPRSARGIQCHPLRGENGMSVANDLRICLRVLDECTLNPKSVSTQSSTASILRDVRDRTPTRATFSVELKAQASDLDALVSRR